MVAVPSKGWLEAMKVRRKHRSTGVAVVATFALILHLAISGFVDGAMASAQALGIFYAPICSAQGESETPHAPDQRGQTHLPDCCMSSCSVAAGAALIAASPAILPSVTPTGIDLPLPVYHRPAQRLDRPPLNPRAPPAIA